MSSQLQELLTLGDKFSAQLKQVTEKLSKTNEQIEKLNQYIKLKEEGENPNLYDFIDEDNLREYFGEQVPNIPLFDENSTFCDFLSWFYDELPYIGLNKLCLVSDSKIIPVENAYIFNTVILNHKDKLIQIHAEPDNTGELLTLCIPNLDLYTMLTVSPVEMEEHILEQAKFREEFYAEY